MRFFMKIKKIILSAIFSIILSTALLSQTGSALTLTPTQVWDVEFNNSLYQQHLTIGRESNADKYVSFLQFDISSLKNTVITATSLKLDYTGGNGGTAAIYAVDNSQNSWVTAPSGTYNLARQNLLIDANPPLVSVALTTQGVYTFSSASLISALQTSVDLTGNNLFSLVIRQSTNEREADFAYSGSTRPKLDVDSSYPTPEPSSAFLSFIGLSAIFMFSKKRDNLL